MRQVQGKIRRSCYHLAALFFLIGCSSRPIHHGSAIAETPTTLGDHILYHTTKHQVAMWIQNTSPLAHVEVIGLKRIRDLGEEFLTDIGGQKIVLDEKKGIFFYYFNPEIYQKREFASYKKWRKNFSLPRNCRLTEIYHVDFESGTLKGLLGLPYNVYPLATAKRKPLGAVLFPALGLEGELDPKYLLTYLSRGFHVISMSYDPSHNVDIETLLMKGVAATTWLKEKLSCPTEDLVISGKSFGSALAIFAALHHEKAALVVEGGFTRMAEIVDFQFPKALSPLLTPLALQAVEKFYRFPSEDWLPLVQGPTLLLESSSTQNKKPLSPTEREGLTIIKTHGSLFGPFWKEDSPVWYEEEKTQEKITQFLLKNL